MLGPVELVLFKALFDRPKDWVDIATVADAGAVDRDLVRDGLVALVALVGSGAGSHGDTAGAAASAVSIWKAGP